MTQYILDASALLRLTDKQKGWQRVEQVITEAAAGKCALWMCAVNWGEVALVSYRRYGPMQARSVIDKLKALPIRIVSADEALAEMAAMMKHDYSLAYADAFAAALTVQTGAGATKDKPVLLTADFDFKNIPSGTLRIEFLPAK